MYAGFQGAPNWSAWYPNTLISRIAHAWFDRWIGWSKAPYKKPEKIFKSENCFRIRFRSLRLKTTIVIFGGNRVYKRGTFFVYISLSMTYDKAISCFYIHWQICSWQIYLKLIDLTILFPNICLYSNIMNQWNLI